MRFPYVGVLASLSVAIACARGQELDHGYVVKIDAGLIDPGGDTGGDGNDPGGEGGAMDNGGAVGSGGTVSTGGTPVPSMGGIVGSGGTGSGGKSGTGGGGKASGGAAGSTGMGGTNAGTGGKASGGNSSGGRMSTGDAGTCMAGQKVCDGVCTPPAPRNGCGVTGCAQCTLQPPANGYVTCLNNACVFDCLSGFTKMGNSCVGAGVGGSGGGTCKPQSCPQNCSAVFGPACCTADGKCGCPVIPWVAPTCVGA